MALIDSDAGEIVIRLVYDGPPEAGKTTSLRALAGSLTRPTYSPAEDADGRTLWFDWMEYVGGRSLKELALAHIGPVVHRYLEDRPASQDGAPGERRNQSVQLRFHYFEGVRSDAGRTAHE